MSGRRVVVDVGNTRIKWGLVAGAEIVATAALPPDDPAEWQKQLEAWQLISAIAWTVVGVHAPRRDTLVAWLQGRGDVVRVLGSYRDLPLTVAVPAPESVGLDRLLDAVAANMRRPHDRPAIIIDAGTAVTVDLVDAAGAFQGGAIFPGLRLMALALHEHTASLPLVEIQQMKVPPGKVTVEAIAAGVSLAVLGGIERLTMTLAARCNEMPETYLTGGDAALLAPKLFATLWPEMTLAGIAAIRPASARPG